MVKNSSSSGAEGKIEGGTGGTCPPPPPLLFSTRNKTAQAKIQKHNINKIYQIELRLKEMTYLMIIAETKKTFSTFQFFHWRYRYSRSGKLITAVWTSNLKKSKLCKFVNKSVCTLWKNKSNRNNKATESCFYKTANPEL